VDNLQDISFLKELKSVKKIKTILYTKQENILTVDKLLQKAAQIEPSNFHVWYSWGVIKKLQDDLAAAEKYLKKALNLKPLNIPALHELGRVLTFKKKYPEAEKIFLWILESQSDVTDITSIINTDILLYIADNYIYWANDEYNKKRYRSWIEITKKAFNSILLAIDLGPSERRIHELHKKICLDFGLRMFQIGDKKKGERYLRRVIAEIRIHGRHIPTNNEALTIAYYNLAKYEKSKLQPNWKLMEIYVRKGLAVSNKEKITESLLKLKKIVMNEKRRKIGQINHFDANRKFGIIKSQGLSCIFFPKCLTWHCKDIAALINRKVSFIPVSHPTATRPDNFKATQINLVET
jgi:tetratricopeptide (TPR) repeat protein